MRQLLIIPALLILSSCGTNQKEVKIQKGMSKKTEERVGTIVLVMAKTQPEYSREEIINLSKKIDPMVDEFDGYLGRKMAFSYKEPDVMVDVVFYTDVMAFEKASEIELKSETCQNFFATMKPEPSKMLIMSPAIITTPLKGEVKAIELVLFKTKEGYTKEQVIKAATGMNVIMKNYEGYVSRKLAVTEDGQWMDLVYWTDLDSAQKASKHILENKLGEAYFKMIDDTTMEFSRLNVVIDTER